MLHAEAYVTLNALMCACALPLGGKLSGLPAPKWRKLVPAALFAGVAALLGLATPSISAAMLLSLPLCVWLCFGAHGFGACVRCTLTTLCASLLTGGAATWLSSQGMSLPAALMASAALSMLLYMLATLLPAALLEVRQVELEADGRSVLLPAMLDSGNLLSDPVTGLPVLVVPQKAVQVLFPRQRDLCSLDKLPRGFRLLSVRTAAGSSLLPMFRPEHCRLYLNGHACEAELLVAVAGREYGGVQALVPMAALPRHGV